MTKLEAFTQYMSQFAAHRGADMQFVMEASSHGKIFSYAWDEATKTHTMNNDQAEVMRITRDGIWVSPDLSVDETAKAVLNALDSHIKVLVQRAVEDEREACAKVCDDWLTGRDDVYSIGKAIRARGKK
jgi:phenolic acid decarboxylase